MPVGPASLAGRGLVRGYVLPAAHLLALSVCVLKNQPAGPRSPSLHFCSEVLSAFVSWVFPERGQGPHPGTTRPRPCPAAAHSGLGGWAIFVKLMPRPYLANKLVFKIILTALDVGVSDKRKDM